MGLLAANWLGRNLSTFLLAFALALAVWVAVVINANPNQECETPRVIPIEVIGEDPALVSMEEIPRTANIRLFAPRSICDDLAAEEQPVKAVADLSGLGPGEHTVPVSPEIPEKFEPYRVLSFSPAEIDISLEPLVTETFPIQLILTGEAALGFGYQRPTLDVETTNISGPQSLVEQVQLVRATLSIAGARQTIQTSLPLLAIDSNGLPLREVTLIPDQVEVTLPVEQLGGYRDVAVKVRTEGQWASGYRLTNISVSPPTLTVFSVDPQAVNSLPGFVETLPVDLTDASDDVETLVELDLPEGVTVVGGNNNVLVQVSIAAIESNLSMSLPVEIIGLSPGYEVVISPDTVDVILFGPVPILDTLTPDNVRVVVDLTDLGEGIHQVTPFVDILPDPVQEQGINPGTVEVTIARPPTPTPTVTPSTTGTPPSP